MIQPNHHFLQVRLYRHHTQIGIIYMNGCLGIAAIGQSSLKSHILLKEELYPIEDQNGGLVGRGAFGITIHQSSHLLEIHRLIDG
jgi:hypothetical protein